MRPTSITGSESTPRPPGATTRPPRLLVTAGEPAGIGPELCLRLAGEPLDARLGICADITLLRDQAERLGLAVTLEPITSPEDLPPHQPGRLAVWHHELVAPVIPGQPDAANADGVLATLDSAADACRDGRCEAMITAPVQKSVINAAGRPFSGHTEYLAARLDVSQPVMLLVAGTLRVALATTHLPLTAVPGAITTDGLLATLEILEHDLRTRFGLKRPRIAVCGLNPHAGEGGHLGDEELLVIEPALAGARARGWRVTGPLPADTAFTPQSLARCDAVLAMYHDQGLPVLKAAGFGEAVNVTLGLPIIRTSVDHGTALDIAGRGVAEVSSLVAAVKLAVTLAQRAASGA